MRTNGKKKLKMIFLLLLSLLIVAGYSRVVYAASGSESSDQIEEERNTLLDPFSLTIILLEESDEIDSRSPIRISSRPELRSYFRPPLY